MDKYGLDGFESLVDLLSKIGQVSGTHAADDRLFLVGKGKGLTQVPACQRHFRFAEQFFAELAVDDRSSE